MRLHRRARVLALWVATSAIATSAIAGRQAGAQPALASTPAAPGISALADTTFARLVRELSEPGGYFDTDNLISNERSVLHALDDLEAAGAHGGAFIGVGPDQGFSYIAHTRSTLAFLLDVRRDNLRQHLFYKALFATARNRAEFLALWLGHPVPNDAARWDGARIEDILAWLDATPSSPESQSRARERVHLALASLPVPLDSADRTTIAHIHDSFLRDGLALRFTSFGRPPRPFYPTLRDLVLETDRRGRRRSYLADEASFQYVKELQRRHRVIPVVGDLAGPHAMRAVARELVARGITVQVLYTSNAEDYVLRDGGFARYVDNVRALPVDDRSVIVRSWFGGGVLPQSVPGYASTQLVQPITAFVRRAASAPWSYAEIVRWPHVPPRP
ncbi:MAG TPA: hypothetical protein PKE51_06170 [Gemmatimonadaceae bacterium]|nr:hypothetical protein [Gemmatimonadaceae bacterium]